MPVALALVTVAVGLLAHMTAAGGLVATITAYSAWALIGGATVRPHGRWREVVLIAGALVALIVLVDIVALMAVAATGNDQPGDDDAAAVGMLFLIVAVFPPTVLPVALGKLARRALGGAA